MRGTDRTRARAAPFSGRSRARARRRQPRLLLAALAAGLAALAIAPAASQAQFQLGLYDPALSGTTSSADTQAAFATFRQVAASTIRVIARWQDVAPPGNVIPPGFDPSNPSDPHYRWAAVDAAVRSAVNNHAQPVMMMFTAPTWAQAPNVPPIVPEYHTVWAPSATQFGYFVLALARRYSGQFPDPLHPGTDLPRVKEFEMWNEENLLGYLAAPDLVGEYRSLLNAGYAAIKSVHPDNVAAIGGLSPVGVTGIAMPPLKFAAALMCLQRVGSSFVRTSACPVPAHFDALAIHPYSLAATPTYQGFNPDDLLVADMGKARALLQAAQSLHTAAPNSQYGLWVTEWSWFSNPPEGPIGDRDPVAARYVAWSMYEMWLAGTSLVTWYEIRYPAGSPAFTRQLFYGGALYSPSGQPTLKLAAFAFPVVAAVRHGHGLVWGRAPVRAPARVFVQHLARRHWKTIGVVRTSADGVFELHFRARGNGLYRARLGRRLLSVAYDSRPIPAKPTHLFNHTG